MRYTYDYYYSQIINLLLIYKDKRINNYGFFMLRHIWNESFINVIFFKFLKYCGCVPEFRFANSKIDTVSSMRNTLIMNCLSSFSRIFDIIFARNLKTWLLKPCLKRQQRKRIKSNERKVSFVACCSRLTCRDTET